MKIRALCTDIDGTLLDLNRQLSVRTIHAIKMLDSDFPVILASSRMPSAMTHLQRELGILHHPLICYNGGYIICHQKGSSLPTVIDSVQIPVSLCSSILSLSHNTAIHVSLYNQDSWYAQKEDEWTAREARITKVTPNIKPFDTVLNEWHDNNLGAHKVMCMGLEPEIHEMYNTLSKNFSDRLHIYRSKSTYLEIAPRQISKASALKLTLKKLYRIDPSEVVAFGDNYNDIELLQAVGLGIAVENAREEVKAVANEITLKNIEDGVAISIEKYLWHESNY
jgi:Cof subfamily protein (haloacid dehalogenase superfamily)